MGYNYERLKRRIENKYGTRRKFAEKAGCSEAVVSGRLTGRTEFSQSDIETWATALQIKKEEYAEYFFKEARE